MFSFTLGNIGTLPNINFTIYFIGKFINTYHSDIPPYTFLFYYTI